MSEQFQELMPGGSGPDGLRTGQSDSGLPQDQSGPVEGLAAQVVRLEERLTESEAEARNLWAEIRRLDADLDESRRLNLRAAELLDVVYSELGKQAPQDEVFERRGK